MTAAPNASQELLDFAHEIALGAGKIAMDWFRKTDIGLEFKGDGTPVTAADKAAERYIRERINEFAPDSKIVGEEEGVSDGDTRLTWYVDPIDGTKAFSRGVPLFSTLIAAEDEHGHAIGIIHIPATGETIWAGRGLGAWTEKGRAQVSDQRDLKGAFITTSAVSRWGCDMFKRIHDAGIDVRTWGDGYGWLMAATGRVDAMIDIGAGNAWDFGPVPVIMSEAGGRFTDLAGDVTIHSPSAAATNGHLHKDLLSVLNG